MIAPKAFRQCEAGSAAIEFAVIGLIAIFVCLGTIEFGRGLHIRNGLSHAADVGARMIFLDRGVGDSALEARIRDEFRAGASDKLQFKAGYEVAGGTGFRTITMSYPFTPLIPGLASDPISLSISRHIPVI